MSTEAIRLLGDGRRGVAEEGMEVGGEGEYIPIAIVIIRMTPALRWAVTRAILMFH